ncbi:MAG TPA: hypothetical protein VGB13_04620 [Candidatus Krumholzibacteria bacterium]
MSASLEEILERARAHYAERDQSLTVGRAHDPWWALDAALTEKLDELEEIRMAAEALYNDEALPWKEDGAGQEVPDWDAMIRRARGEA